MKKRPNILILMTDEHRADVLGYEGNSIIRTPNIDKLASRGVVFKNAYTPSPICIPARQCLMAGQFPRTCGCERFEEDLPPFYETFAKVFSRYAYATVACGKLHHVGIDQMQGWSQRIGSDQHVNNHFIEGRIEEEFKNNIEPKEKIRWSNAKEVKRAGIGKARNAVEDEYTTLGALNFIESYFSSPYYDHDRAAQPLLLKVSLVQPHYPYFAEENKFKYYLNRVKPYINQAAPEHAHLGWKELKVGKDVSEREVRRCTAAYYAMIETADELIGKVIEKLEEVGQDLEEWIILFTSDHGEMLGEHSVWAKHNFYEGSVRVPFFISWPKKFKGGRVVYENINLYDIYATLCDLAQIPIPEGLDSRSLVPLLEQKKVDWSNETISQYKGKFLMIKWDNLKYQYYGEEMEEVLFDLERDLSETKNFISDGQYKEILERFRKRRNELGFGPSINKNS